MRLTAKLILTLIAVVIPLTAAFTLWRYEVERKAAQELEVTRMATRFSDRVARRCEARPERFEVGRGRSRGHRGRRRPREGAPFVGFAYAPDFASRNPSAPAFPQALAEALRGGDDVAHLHRPQGRFDGASAFRLADEGPCAILLVAWRQPPIAFGAPARTVVLQSAALLALLVLSAMLVGLPLVRRIRRLQRAAEAPLDERVDALAAQAGSADEIGELAGVLAEATRRVGETIEALRERDEALEEYIGNTTHDLAIPVTVLQHRLRRLQQKGLDPEARELVDAALEESVYVASLVANMAAAARLEAGEVHVTRHAVDMGPLIERVAARNQPFAEARRVDFNWSVPPEPLEVEADSTLVEQAVSNLVQNAVQYVGEAGHVGLVLEARGEGFVIEVIDDGPGLPEELLGVVRQRARRTDAARTRNPGGQGFGLSIAADVCEEHGWTLTLENREEGGLRARIEG